MYKIEKVLKTRTCQGKLLVRWLGYNSDFDSWIPAEDVHNILKYLCDRYGDLNKTSDF